VPRLTAPGSAVNVGGRLPQEPTRLPLQLTPTTHRRDARARPKAVLANQCRKGREKEPSVWRAIRPPVGLLSESSSRGGASPPWEVRRITAGIASGDRDPCPVSLRLTSGVAGPPDPIRWEEPKARDHANGNKQERQRPQSDGAKRRVELPLGGLALTHGSSTPAGCCDVTLARRIDRDDFDVYCLVALWPMSAASRSGSARARSGKRYMRMPKGSRAPVKRLCCDGRTPS
jgi:hypothetical protein